MDNRPLLTRHLDMTFSDDTNPQLCAALLDALPVQLCLLDGAGRVVQANRAWSDFVEPCSLDSVAEPTLVELFESLPGVDEITTQRLEQGIQAVLQGDEERLSLRYPYLDSPGIRWYELTAISLAQTEQRGALILQLELTAERRREEARKLESLEQLAGGVAHDFNNYLTGILGYADLAQLSLEEDSPVRNHLEHLRLGAKRAAALTHELLAYSRKGSMSFRALQLSTLVEKAVGEVRGSMPASCSLCCDLAPELPEIEADAEQLTEIIGQLVRNAIDAIGEEDGTITVTTGRVERREEELAALSSGEDLPGGTYIFVEVADSGCGIPAELQSRIFDPFFTTQTKRRGLGLAVVQGMVRAHRGAIELTSAPGKGSRFRVLLPYFG